MLTSPWPSLKISRSPEASNLPAPLLHQVNAGDPVGKDPVLGRVGTGQVHCPGFAGAWGIIAAGCPVSFPAPGAR